MPDARELVSATAAVKNGRLFLRNRREFDRQIAQMNEGWSLEVSVKRQRATRSQQQNAYYWGVVIERLVEQCDFNYTADDMHELLKARFIPKRMAIADGNGEIVAEYVFGGSTRRMNTLEFGDYLRDIKAWALDKLKLEIPEPDAEF